LIGFGLMHLADSWFGPRQIVGECLIDHPTPIVPSSHLLLKRFHAKTYYPSVVDI
jgi:hypothetical protein